MLMHDNDSATRVLRGLVAGVYGILLTVGAFTSGIWAIGGIALAIILFGACWAADRRMPRPDMRLFGLVVLALAVMAITNLFSTYPTISWKLWVNLTTIFIPLSLLTAPQIQERVFNARLFPLAPVVLMVGALALGIELHFDGVMLHWVKNASASLTEYNRSMAFLVLMSFPIMAGIWQSSRRWLVVPFLLVLLYPAGLTESRTAKLALMVGIAVVTMASFWPTLVRRALMAGVVPLMGWAFAARWFFINHYESLAKFPPSWRARIEIWDYMSYRIMEHPLLGWGLGTAHKLDFHEPHGAAYVFTTYTASHPHNVMTELWVELGVAGLVLGFLFALYTLHKIGRIDARIRPFALGAWAACLCLSLVGFDFWSDAIFAAFALTAFAFAGLERGLGSGFLAASVRQGGRAGDNPHHAE